jgi:hypothetical protein
VTRAFAAPQIQHIMCCIGGSANLCLRCHQEVYGDSCFWCEFTLPEVDELIAEFDGSATSHTGVESGVDRPENDEQEEPRRAYLPSRFIPPSYSSFPAARRVYGSLWFCHTCGDGPKMIALQPACVQCGHVACGFCRIV